MANKTIISTRLPEPSRRIIGGSSQRSRIQARLQEPPEWKNNHAPVDADESQNAYWWKHRANRYDAPLSSSGDVLYSRQTTKRELEREEDRKRLSAFSVDLDAIYHAGDNVSINKKTHIRDLSFGSFEAELDIANEVVPNIKKMLSFKATKDGISYRGEQITPFTSFSSSVSTGYREIISNTLSPNVGFNNLHSDSIEPHGKVTPMQGPFTERFVGGVQARHTAPLQTKDRKEAYHLAVDLSTKATSTIEIKPGVVPSDLEDETLSVTVNGVLYSAIYNDDVNKGDSTKTIIGTSDCSDAEDVAEAIENSINLSISGDGLPITVSRNVEELTFTASQPGPDYNAIWSSSASEAEVTITKNFTDGLLFGGSVRTHTTGTVPKGQYFRNSAAKAPVNIANIQTATGSVAGSGVGVVGNYTKNYEVIQGNDQAITNLDFILNNSHYSYKAPSAFLTSPARAALGLTGSADYPAPRQRSGRRITQSIIVNRFAAPGSKFDSKQQFRDVNSDQLSPNNSLPYRNLGVRIPFHKDLGTYTGFGGYLSSSNTPAIVQTQRNQTQRVELLSSTTFQTGTVFDTAYVTRPVPAGDSTQWFMSLSGSNSNVYSLYVLSGSIYPDKMMVQTASLPSGFSNGTSVYTNINGQERYIWSRYPFYAPWTQTRQGETNEGSYYRKNNIYELPAETNTKSEFRSSVAPGTLSRTFVDQAGNISPIVYSKTFVETPITSRYKPLVHKIKTPLGSPAQTSDQSTNVTMQYSYGNSLMGFANRQLNRDLAGRYKFLQGEIKRPYEVIRDQRNEGVSPAVNGIEQINMFVYPETIYPREVFTYLSGSRSRLSFQSNFWKNDKVVSFAAASASISSFSVVTDITSLDNISTYNRQYPRISSNFITSQGYPVQAKDQTPYNPSGSFLPPVGASGPGSGSIWPLDSFLWSDYTDDLVSILTASVPMLLSDAGTMAAGELLMTQYGTVKDGIASSTPLGLVEQAASYTTSSVLSSQYVYNVPSTVATSSVYPGAFATAGITSSFYEGQPNAFASGSVTFGAAVTSGSIHGDKLVIGDLVSNYEFEFDGLATSTTYTAPTSYSIGISGSSATEIRNRLLAAIGAAAALPGSTPPLDASAATSGDYVINLTAGTAGTGFNGETISWGGSGGSSGVTVVEWAGGSTYSLNGLTVTLNDTSTTRTYTFNSSLPVFSSTTSSIGSQGASNTVLVATGIAFAIATDAASGNVGISTSFDGSSNVVPLVFGYPGTAGNSAAIGGTYISAGSGSATGFHGGINPNTTTTNKPEPRSPGSVYSRPPWTAGVERRYVDGPSKGQIAAQSAPFYNSYEDYAEEIRLLGKEYTIVPEYRISSHIQEFQDNGSVLSIISSSLELTGANQTNTDGTNSDFYTRYALTDEMEFLDYFMGDSTEDKNYIFNKYPRHFELSSNTIVKLLPYDGFYPVQRTLDISGLFSSSYAPSAIYQGNSSTSPEAWRSLLRPFYSPGIMYNSIKSGLAVDYPVRRSGRNENQFYIAPGPQPSHTSSLDQNCLHGALTVVPAAQIPGNKRRNLSSADWSGNSELNNFFWADRLPFESILSPEDFLRNGFDKPIVLSDINYYLGRDVSGSFSEKSLDGSLYKKAVSNFLANVPQFFLAKKSNKYGESGYLTKFVSQFGTPSRDNQQITSAVRRVSVDPSKAYMMEVGLLKTDNFNFYSNPYAFGIATATGSTAWNRTLGWHPVGDNWPRHRGEFAPFTPPHYYGPSLVRITFMPSGKKSEYTLDEIINNDDGEVFVNFLNESGSYYDAASGSFVLRDDSSVLVSTTSTPVYGWNRAWQNRMDLDATLNISNEFPLGKGGTYRSQDPNKWTIMPKWESPILDFPNRGTTPMDPDAITPSDLYEFSSSVTNGKYFQETQGMWHQYGVMPQSSQGTYMYIKDIPTGDEEEYDLVSLVGTSGITTGSLEYVRKIPPFVSNSGREVSSLADLCGFDSDEIIRSGLDLSKAKRMGELGLDGEKSLSEAILALPFYLNDNGDPTLMTLRAPGNQLGPKIKEFRKKFTKFSLPPALALKLLGMVPKGYPNVPDIINPFGPDDYDEILSGEEMSKTPVVYLMEHKINLSRQDLSDIWQGIMPEIGQKINFSFSAIDHYMPGDEVEETSTKFPEVLKEQISLGAQRTGHPRYDLLDIAESCDKGFYPGIKWLVFKIKEKGITSYSQMIMEEVDGPSALNVDNVKQLYNLQGLAPDQVSELLSGRDSFSKNAYLAKHSLYNPTYNWPYDYFSLIEASKINTKVGFRPDLAEEYNEMSDRDSGRGTGRSMVDSVGEAVKVQIRKEIENYPGISSIISSNQNNQMPVGSSTNWRFGGS